MSKRPNFYRLLERCFRLLLRVVRGFRRNQGLLLAGAVAYHTLLSIVPLSIIALIVLLGAQVIAELEYKPAESRVRDNSGFVT